MEKAESDSSTTLGVVSYLNARPLIDGLAEEAGIDLHYEVPAQLPAMLRDGLVDVALVPVVDFACTDNWARVSDACIASDGETMTVRVFSRVRPERINILHADSHSHTSIALARLIWHHCYNRQLELKTFNAKNDLCECQAVLLIGDKVVNTPADDFEYDIDLGSVWKQWIDLPFVFALWAGPTGRNYRYISQLLSQARDRGVAQATEIAANLGPRHGWPIELAEEYLIRRLQYTLTPQATEGMNQFIKLASELGVLEGAPETVR